MYSLLTNPIILSPPEHLCMQGAKKGPTAMGPLPQHEADIPREVPTREESRCIVAFFQFVDSNCHQHMCHVQVTASSICCQNLSTSTMQAFGAKMAAQWALAFESDDKIQRIE